MKLKAIHLPQGVQRIIKIVPANIYAIILLFVAFWLICEPGTFLTGSNVLNIVEQCTLLAIVSVGSFMAIVTRGIDLSLDATMSMSGVIAAQLIKSAGLPVVVAMAAAILAAMLIGMLNGLIISRNNVAPFIITLGTANIAQSLALIVSKNMTVSANIPAFRFIGGAYLFNVIPISIFVVVLMYVIFSTVTRKTRLGTYMYAVGGNEASAILTGIDVKRVKFWTYTFGGLLAGVAGVLLASRLGSGSPSQGTGYEFYGIASAVVGGASMTGGRGTVWKTLSGAFIISSLRNGLNMAGLPTSLQMIALGVIIVGVVTVDSLSRRGK